MRLQIAYSPICRPLIFLTFHYIPALSFSILSSCLTRKSVFRNIQLYAENLLSLTKMGIMVLTLSCHNSFQHGLQESLYHGLIKPEFRCNYTYFYSHSSALDYLRHYVLSNISSFRPELTEIRNMLFLMVFNVKVGSV